MIRTQVSLSRAEFARAKKAARDQGVSFAEFIRRAVRPLFPVDSRKPWMRYAGIVESGDKRASQRIDEIVYGQKG
jgi:hypothetical protein